jgi:hypothetical protein
MLFAEKPGDGLNCVPETEHLSGFGRDISAK